MPSVPSALLLLTFFAATVASAQRVPIAGTVVDVVTSAPVAGCRVAELATGEAVYTFPDGTFRLPLAPGHHELVVTSPGYQPARVVVSEASPDLMVRITPRPYEKLSPTAIGNVDANDLMRRVIARRDQIVGGIEGMQQRIYSKFTIDVQGQLFGLVKDSNRLAVQEMFMNDYFRRDAGERFQVIARRKTATIPKFDKLYPVGRFFSFYDDEIRILNATIASPLGSQAFDRYHFSVRDASAASGSVVYTIGVESATTAFPTFQGTMRVRAGSYDVVDVDLSLAPGTAVAFVGDARFHQQFDSSGGGRVLPVNLLVNGTVIVDLLLGISKLTAPFTSVNIISQLAVNGPVPDSVFKNRDVITLLPTADSVRSIFWRQNAYAAYGSGEERIYRRMDSVLDFASAHPANGLSIGALPYIDFNRAGSVTLGVAPRFGLGPVTVSGNAAYSFGLRHGVGEGGIAVAVLDRENDEGRPLQLSLRAGLFSMIASTTTDRTYSRLMNSLVAGGLHSDYYDYYLKEGKNVGVDFVDDRVRLGVTAEMARHASLPVTTNRSLLTNKAFRPNPEITPGNYQLLQADVTMGSSANFITIAPLDVIDVTLGATGVAGREQGSGTTFESFEALGSLLIPTFRTGYNPMTITLFGAAGAGTATLPPQYQFRLRTSASTIGKAGGFVSAPTGVYGGTEYIATGGEFNTTDLPWRALGLPTYHGRGPELILAGATGRFRQRNSVGYLPTGDNWYSEVGFGLGRIPLFVTDLLSLRFDMRFGIGPLGKFNANVGLITPL